MKSMKAAAEQAQTQTKADDSASSTITPGALGVTKFVLNEVEYTGVKVHSLKFLPERESDDGGTLMATFGGFVERFTDPLTGEVRGVSGQKNSVPLTFFGRAAEQWKAVLLDPWIDENGEEQPPRLKDPKSDAIYLGVREDAEDLNTIRLEDGRLKVIVASSRTFSGKIKIIPGAPNVKFEIG